MALKKDHFITREFINRHISEPEYTGEKKEELTKNMSLNVDECIKSCLLHVGS